MVIGICYSASHTKAKQLEKKEDCVRLVPETAAELGSNIRWVVAKRLEIIEEIALGSQTSGRESPDMDEAWERAWEAVGRREREAEDEALVHRTRAEVWEWWQGFSERSLLTAIYRRAVLRESGGGGPDKRRLPTHSEGLRIARALLSEISDRGHLVPEHEAATVAQVLADQLLPPIGTPSRPLLRGYIKRSESSRVHFEALNIIYEKLKSQGKAIPSLLARWHRDFASGRRQRPIMKPVPAHPPTNQDRLKRDIRIQFTIGLLQRLGVPPYGSYQGVSGCSIVSQALLELSDCGILPTTLGLSEGSVERIWKECTWRASFMPVMRKYSKAIAERTGLHPH